MAKKYKNKYVPLSKKKYPFGGLINQGLTDVAGALGADEKTAHLIGDVGATATGFIPGFQDNFMQAGNLAGDIAGMSKNKNIQNAGKAAKIATGIIPQFMADGGVTDPTLVPPTQQQPINNQTYIPFYYQRKVGNNLQYFKTGEQATANTIGNNGYATQDNLQNFQSINPNEFFNAAKTIPNQIGYGPVTGDLKTTPEKRFYNQEEIHAAGGMQSYKLAQGGETNAEVEGGETMRDPNGETQQFQGSSHEQGGIPANLEQGTQIFSDRLKSQTGKTFAKESKKYDTSKYKKIIDDKASPELAKKTAELMFQKNNQQLTKLFEEQESQKDNNFSSDMFAFGGQLTYGKGGTIHIKESHKGLFTRSAKKAGYSVQEYASKVLAHKENYSSQLVKRANFARNVSKWKHGDGGTIDANKLPVYFADGGQISKQEALDKMQTSRIHLSTFAPGGTFGDPKVNIRMGNNQTASYPGDPNDFQPEDSTGPNWGKIATEAGIGLANNLGPATYLAQQGKSYDKQNFYGYKPTTLDPTNAMRDVDQSTYSARRAAPGYSGGSGSLAINALLANKLQGDTTKADIRQKYDEANAGITNQGQQYNIDNQYMTDNINASNKGVALQNYYKSVDAIGNNVAQQGRDIQTYGSQEKMDNMGMKTLEDLYNNYTFDKKSGGWLPKKRQ
jgi:hypothetical protein